MKLLTEELRKTLPVLYSTDNQGLDAMVQLKIFDPCGAAIWFITEFDGCDIFFGWAFLGDIDCAELGYMSLSEMERYRGPLGIGLEIDQHWNPKPLRQAIAELKTGLGI